jgi:hypothetical protein
VKVYNLHPNAGHSSQPNKQSTSTDYVKSGTSKAKQRSGQYQLKHMVENVMQNLGLKSSEA